ncbi:MAG: ABC transporter permease [Actinobacteria bacterium]|nr:ABC transporter permease [Actinomycetota bacterium]
MNSLRIRAIIEKEWTEFGKSRLMLITSIVLPLVFSLIPIVMAIVFKYVEMPEAKLGDMSRFYAMLPGAGSLTKKEVFEVTFLSAFLYFYLIVPAWLPMSMATNSIVAEKERKSLEPMLASPMAVSELFFGKLVSAFIPSIVITWAMFILYLIFMYIFLSPAAFGALFGFRVFMAMFVLAPILSIISVTLGIIISSKIKDIRSAQQVGGVIILPVLIPFYLQVMGAIMLNWVAMLVGSIVLAFVAYFIFRIAVRTFDKEAILTKWK